MNLLTELLPFTLGLIGGLLLLNWAANTLTKNKQDKSLEEHKLHTWKYRENGQGMYCEVCGLVPGTVQTEHGEY